MSNKKQDLEDQNQEKSCGNRNVADSQKINSFILQFIFPQWYGQQQIYGNSVVKQYLENNSIDLTEGEGVYFKSVLLGKNKDLLQYFLNYYEDYIQKNNQKDQYSIPLAKHKLSLILQSLECFYSSDDEIKAILEKYIPEDSDRDSDEDFSNQQQDIHQFESYKF